MSRQQTRIIIQARVGSSRLPAKILADVMGEPLLAHVVRRMRAASQQLAVPCQVMVATTAAAEDDATEQLCTALRVDCFRGDYDNVLKRYLDASADLDDSALVLRATADNPLYCALRTAAIVVEHQQRSADYSCIEQLSYVVPEVIRAGALRAMAARATDAYCREHVTPYFRQHPQEFVTLQLPRTWRGLRPEIRLTIDTPAELAGIQQLLSAVAESECAAGDALPSLETLYAMHERLVRGEQSA